MYGLSTNRDVGKFNVRDQLLCMKRMCDESKRSRSFSSSDISASRLERLKRHIQMYCTNVLHCRVYEVAVGA